MPSPSVRLHRLTFYNLGGEDLRIERRGGRNHLSGTHLSFQAKPAEGRMWRGTFERYVWSTDILAPKTTRILLTDFTMFSNHRVATSCRYITSRTRLITKSARRCHWCYRSSLWGGLSSWAPCLGDLPTILYRWSMIWPFIKGAIALISGQDASLHHKYALA
jgi:hypothetical protein